MVSASNSSKNKKHSKSIQTLHQILKSRDFEVKRVKLFQSMLGTIRISLTFQSQLIVDQINKENLELPMLKERSTEKDLSPQEKQRRWKSLKNSVFFSLFDQLYAVRISNMVSVITMTQTGKRYFRNEIVLKQSSSGADGILQQADEGNPKFSDSLK